MMKSSTLGPVLLRVPLVLAIVILALPTFASDEPQSESEVQMVAYYFHGNLRCNTCRKLEAYSEEAISKGFADKLTAGDIEWRAVNTDEPENKHFIKDFELTSKSLVLVEYRDGEVKRWQNLKLIWQLVGDKDGFLKYVRDATSDFLAEG
jgi:hypothetical protein